MRTLYFINLLYDTAPQMIYLQVLEIFLLFGKWSSDASWGVCIPKILSASMPTHCTFIIAEIILNNYDDDVKMFEDIPANDDGKMDVDVKTYGKKSGKTTAKGAK